jgi:hypothetical protein
VRFSGVFLSIVQEDEKPQKTGGLKPLGMKSASKLLDVLDEVIHEKKMEQAKSMG